MGAVGIDEVEFCDLFSRVKGGDRRALDQLLTLHRTYLLSVVELRMDHKLRTRIDPSDVVQEAQWEAACRIAEYLDREPMPFHIWLRKTACERLLRLRRQHVDADCRSVDREIRSARQFVSAAGPENPQPGAKSRSPGRRDGDGEPPPPGNGVPCPRRIERSLLIRNFEGLTNEEAAQVLDLEPAAASKRYGRAILKLRGLLLAQGVS